MNQNENGMFGYGRFGRNICVFILVLLCSSATAETRYVSVDGDDSNPGTRQRPWRTLRAACVRLNPGDRLLVGPGDYVEFEDDGVEDFRDTIFVRTVGSAEENFAYKPFVGSPDKQTVIRPRNKRSRPRVFGSFDIRGSFLKISGLEIVGDAERSIAPGIGVYSSHDIACVDNVVRDHGGGGISFNQCDMVLAMGNVCFRNATTNPNQSSGISSYQPIRRAPSDARVGVRIISNICFWNQNKIAGPFGITDGNGIVADDHFYTQTNRLITDTINGTPDPSGVGTPVIRTRLESNDNLQDSPPTEVPLPYERRTLIRNNFCFGNGGRGIHLYLADNASVSGNTLFRNLQSKELYEALPRDEAGQPYFRNGELSSSDSTNLVMRSNLMVAWSRRNVAANEFYFDKSPIRPSGNVWRRNCYVNGWACELYSLAGLEAADSSLAQDANPFLPWFLRIFR